MGVAHAIGAGKAPKEIYEQIKKLAAEMKVQAPLMKAIVDAATSPPADYLHQPGWVLIAFQNALWQLLDAESLEVGVVDTVMRGGDTDTNAAVAGALLGAVYRVDAIPTQWRVQLLNCRPEAGRPHVRHRAQSAIGRWTLWLLRSAWSRVEKSSLSAAMNGGCQSVWLVSD